VSCRRGPWSQAVDEAQDFREQPPWIRHLGKLERDVPTVPDHLGADLDQLLAQRRQRLLFDLLRQLQCRLWVRIPVGQGH
jgi:hypothetical protein